VDSVTCTRISALLSNRAPMRWLCCAVQQQHQIRPEQENRTGGGLRLSELKLACEAQGTDGTGM